MSSFFWGRDAERIAVMVRAPRIGDSEFGWRDLTVAEAEAHASDVLRARESTGAVFAQDYRPHTTRSAEGGFAASSVAA